MQNSGNRKGSTCSGNEEPWVHRMGEWSKQIELGTCTGTRLGLYSHSFGLCLAKKMFLFSVLHLALNEHSGHNASAKRFVITKILVLVAIPKEKFQKCIKQRKL